MSMYTCIYYCYLTSEIALSLAGGYAHTLSYSLLVRVQSAEQSHALPVQLKGSHSSLISETACGIEGALPGEQRIKYVCIRAGDSPPGLPSGRRRCQTPYSPRSKCVSCHSLKSPIKQTLSASGTHSVYRTQSSPLRTPKRL